MSSTPSQLETEATPDPRRWRMLALVCLAQFMVVLDITVVNVALPTIGAELRLSRAEVAWVVIAYVLCFGGLMLLGGRLADLLGRRNTFLAGLALFTLASLGAGLAGGGGALVAARAVQGVGAALLSPSALSIIATTFHGRERQRALAISAAIAGGGAGFGVLVGGALVSGASWQWVFFVNAPVGLLVAVATPALVPALPGRRGRLDVPGALAVTAGLALIIFGLVAAGDLGWGSAGVLGPLVGGAALLGVFVAVERRSPAPLVSLRLLTERSTVAGTAVMLAATALVIASFFVSSIYLQRVVGLSALATGLTFLPITVGIVVGAHLAGHAVLRHGARPVAAVGFGAAAIGLALLSQTTSDGGLPFVVYPSFVALAVGAGATFVTATTTAVGRVAAEEAGAASAVLNTAHELGGALGVATISTIAGASVDIAAGTPPLPGFGNAYLAAAIFAGAAALGAPLLLPAGRPPASDGPMFLH